MNEHEKWLADQCLQIVGDKDRGTLEYIKSIASRASSLDQLYKGLNQFDIPTDDNPRNTNFAANLFEKFGSRTIAQKKSVAEVKQRNSYSLVEMDLSKGKKAFINDQQATNVKDADMLRKRDAQERDALAARIMEQDKSGIKSKLTKHNMAGVVLSEEQKLRDMPGLREAARTKFLQKREKQALERANLVLKDEKNIFDPSDLTMKELKMRHLKQKAMIIAQKNTIEQKREGEYRVPQNAQIDLRPAKDKKIKALYGRYQDVPNALPDSQAWESSQNTRAKGAYRTIDEIQLKQKKNYEILVSNLTVVTF